ncbi:MAG: hypothetical protein NTX14_00815 [Candidatus Nealsonbacteria bacterium]|nr:hypothetical protein [Candidatus Nealsonbacteria bacterium]
MVEPPIEQRLMEIIGPLIRDASASMKDSKTLAKIAIHAGRVALATTSLAEDQGSLEVLGLAQRWIDGEDVKDDLETATMGASVKARKERNKSAKNSMVHELIASICHGALMMRLTDGLDIRKVSGVATSLGADIFGTVPLIIRVNAEKEAPAILEKLLTEVKELAAQ